MHHTLRLVKIWNSLAAISVATLLMAGCNSNFVPKPRGYFAIPLPQKAYQVFNQPGYPYQFEYPAYAQIVKDTTYFDATPENPWWINIDFPQFGGRIYISYKQLATNNLSKLITDAYNLTYKHTYKASSIEDSVFRNPAQIPGVFFRVGGNAATANQFYLTDSSKHFLRGALYFDASPNEDSLQPVNDFLLQDLKHLITSFKWNK
ncbi:MAG TPA: hypothetical protein PKD90_07050 [Phnomibacter sp.]|nr:hypothetical protein [Phnomibacter sp.]